MYDLASSEFTNLSDVYKGPAKSIPERVKGGSSETRSSGSSGVCGSENCHPSILLHLTHLLKIFLTACRPRMIQYRSLRVVRVVFTPLCIVFARGFLLRSDLRRDASKVIKSVFCTLD